MSIKYYIVEDQVPSWETPYSAGFAIKNGRREYGMYRYSDPDSWELIVANAHFRILALGYDEDKDDFCTVLEIERPNGELSTFFWWWESHYDEDNRYGNPVLFDDLRFLCTHYGVQMVSDPDTFDRCMTSYRIDKDVVEWFATLEDLKACLDKEDAPAKKDEPAKESSIKADHIDSNAGNSNELDDLDYMLSSARLPKHIEITSSPRVTY